MVPPIFEMDGDLALLTQKYGYLGLKILIWGSIPWGVSNYICKIHRFFMALAPLLVLSIQV